MPNPKLPILTVPALGLRFHWSFLGQSVMNTLYYQGGAAFDPLPPLSEVVALVRGAIEDDWLNCISVGTSLARIEAKWLNYPEIAPYTLVPLNVSGNRPGEPSPSFVALRMYRRTGFGGKRARGMMRIAGISEDDTTGNSPAAGLAEELALLEGSLLSVLTGGILGANTLLPSLCTTEPSPEAPLGYVTRGAAVLDWVAGPYLGTQNTRKQRSTV